MTGWLYHLLLLWHHANIVLQLWHHASTELQLWHRTSIVLQLWHHASTALQLWHQASTVLQLWHRVSIVLQLWHQASTVLRYEDVQPRHPYPPWCPPLAPCTAPNQLQNRHTGSGLYSRHRPGLFRWRLCSGDCSLWINKPAFSDAWWSCDPSNTNKIGQTEFPYIRTNGVELAPWFAQAFCYKPRTFSKRTENIPVYESLRTSLWELVKSELTYLQLWHHSIAAIAPCQHSIAAMAPCQHSIAAMAPCQHSIAAMAPCQHCIVAMAPCQHSIAAMAPCQHSIAAMAPCKHSIAAMAPCQHSIAAMAPCQHSIAAMAPC